MVGNIKTIEEHISSVATQRTITIAVRIHYLCLNSLVILPCQCRHSTKRECTISMLDNLVADQSTTPVGLVAVASTYVGILLMDIGT